jgi:hypothetical protein
MQEFCCNTLEHIVKFEYLILNEETQVLIPRVFLRVCVFFFFFSRCIIYSRPTAAPPPTPTNLAIGTPPKKAIRTLEKRNLQLPYWPQPGWSQQLMTLRHWLEVCDVTSIVHQPISKQ